MAVLIIRHLYLTTFSKIKSTDPEGRGISLRRIFLISRQFSANANSWLLLLPFFPNKRKPFIHAVMGPSCEAAWAGLMHYRWCCWGKLLTREQLLTNLGLGYLTFILFFPLMRSWSAKKAHKGKEQIKRNQETRKDGSGGEKSRGEMAALSERWGFLVSFLSCDFWT